MLPESLETALGYFLDNLEEATPQQRAEVFATVRKRYCPDCGHPREDCDCYARLLDRFP